MLVGQRYGLGLGLVGALAFRLVQVSVIRLAFVANVVSSRDTAVSRSMHLYNRFRVGQNYHRKVR